MSVLQDNDDTDEIKHLKVKTIEHVSCFSRLRFVVRDGRLINAE